MISEQASGIGRLTIKRIYGDFSISNHWKNPANEHGFQPIQQFAYTKGKNSTDIALIIEAMDILHSGDVDGFVIVSNDSDFTRLAGRVREAGLLSIGIGSSLASRSFMNACDEFILLDDYGPNDLVGIKESKFPHQVTTKEQSAPPNHQQEELRLQNAEFSAILPKSLNMLDSIDGWYSLADVGNQIRNLNPGFSPRWYGHEKLLSLVQSMPIIEIKQTDHIPPNYFIRTLEQTNNDVSIVVMPSSDESESPPSVQYFNTSGPGQRFPASPQSTAMVIHSVVSNAGLCSSPSELKQKVALDTGIGSSRVNAIIRCTMGGKERSLRAPPGAFHAELDPQLFTSTESVLDMIEHYVLKLWIPNADHIGETEIDDVERYFSQVKSALKSPPR